MPMERLKSVLAVLLLIITAVGSVSLDSWAGSKALNEHQVSPSINFMPSANGTFHGGEESIQTIHVNHSTNGLFIEPVEEGGYFLITKSGSYYTSLKLHRLHENFEVNWTLDLTGWDVIDAKVYLSLIHI